jgi:hypothetical protein
VVKTIGRIVGTFAMVGAFGCGGVGGDVSK